MAKINEVNVSKLGFVISEIIGFLEYEILDYSLLYNVENEKLFLVSRDFREKNGYSEIKCWEKLTNTEEIKQIIKILSWE